MTDHDHDHDQDQAMIDELADEMLDCVSGGTGCGIDGSGKPGG